MQHVYASTSYYLNFHLAMTLSSADTSYNGPKLADTTDTNVVSCIYYYSNFHLAMTLSSADTSYNGQKLADTIDTNVFCYLPH